MSENNYRVRIIIYDDAESTIDDPFVFTDEPMLTHPDEMAAQAQRTHRHYIKKLAGEQ